MLEGSKRVEPDEPICKLCRDMGMLVVRQPNGDRVAEPCTCRKEKRTAQLLQRSHIPERYSECTLENYRAGYEGAHKSLSSALILANRFVSDYPHRAKGIGLLFTGSIGTGKTHLAVGILDGLVRRRGVRGLFCDHRELLKAVNNSYNPKVSTTELEVLKPVFEAEVLVIDELGSAKKTEWVSDIVEHILNTRYNDHRTTIITTNYPNLPAGRTAAFAELAPHEEPGSTVLTGSGDISEDGLTPLDRLRNDLDRKRASDFSGSHVGPIRQSATWPKLVGQAADPRGIASPGKRMSTGETLGDRIGERMRSRLAEMCVVVELAGKDYRQGAKKASFR